MSIGLVLLPGPDTMLVAGHAARRGFRAGMAAIGGIQVGGLFYMALCGFGFLAVLNAVPGLFMAVKIAGALYLIWIGIGMIRSRMGSPDQPVAPPKTVKRALLDSFIVEILNPKVALFFIALLPQFVDPSASLPVWAQFLILGMVVNFAFSSADLVTVFGASLVVGAMKKTKASFAFGRWIGGSLMIALGLKLATDRG